MLDEKSRQQIAPAVRTAQIILGALAAGVLTFAVLVLVVFKGEPQANNTLTTVAVAFGVVDLVLSFLVPSLVAANARRRIADGTWQASQNQGPLPDTDAGKLAMVYQTKMIIGAALLEGGCFLALYAYMSEGHWPGLTVAALLLICLLAHFPTSDRMETWIDEQLRRNREEQMFR